MKVFCTLHYKTIMTFALCKQKLIDTHKELIEQLEDEYKNHITKLLEQKKLVIIELQNALCQQFMNIEKVSNQFTSSALSSEEICMDSNETLSTNQLPIFSLKDTNPYETTDSETKSNCDNGKGTKVESSSIQTEAKLYKCHYCNYQGKSHYHLERHIRIHTGEKPYKCDYCNKGFNQKTHLIQHIRVHTGEKPYKCDHCEYRAQTKQNLKNHIRIHTGEKPYKCDHCEYRARTKQNLKSHTRIHQR